MFKCLLFSLLAFSSSAFAQTVTVQLAPASPLLMMTDFKMDAGNGTVTDLKAPWFSGDILVMNNGVQQITLQSQTLTISNAAGFSNSVTQPVNASVMPGAGLQMRGYYSLVGLPDPGSFKFKMTVTGADANGTQFSSSVDFVLTVQ
jgi:hypothetical protein